MAARLVQQRRTPSQRELRQILCPAGQFVLCASARVCFLYSEGALGSTASPLGRALWSGELSTQTPVLSLLSCLFTTPQPQRPLHPSLTDHQLRKADVELLRVRDGTRELQIL